MPDAALRGAIATNAFESVLIQGVPVLESDQNNISGFYMSLGNSQFINVSAGVFNVFVCCSLPLF